MRPIHPSIASLFVHILVPGKGGRVQRVLHRIEDVADDVRFDTSGRFHDLLPFVSSLGEKCMQCCCHVSTIGCILYNIYYLL